MKGELRVIHCYFLLVIGITFSSFISCSNPNGNSQVLASSQDLLSPNNDTQDLKKNRIASDSKTDEMVTPEMFGATGNGTIHKLSEKYKRLQDAQKDYPGVKDLDVSFDGAAFQKAVDFVFSKGGGTVKAEKKYAINFPIITRDNVTIDGKGKGIVSNDRSRKKYVFHYAFFIGNHHGAAFNTSTDSSGAYVLYDVKDSVGAGQNFVQLAKASDVAAFKNGQLIMVISAVKRKQLRRTLLPYHVTANKIVKIDGAKLYFEYPIDESLSSAQIAANGGYDAFTEMNYQGVQNVNILNLSVDASQITGRTFGYNCHIDNIKLVNGYRLIGANALAHTTVSNISGTFSWRCIEIKTGSSDLTLKNINAQYKAVHDTDRCRGVISLGEYNRNITIDSFKIDLGSQKINQPIITLQARKATILNGIINCKNQTDAFLKFYNEKYIDNPIFGCYGNKVSNVKFYGSQNMKSVISIGDKPEGNEKARQKNPGNKTGVGVPPSGNVVENCLFDGGSAAAVASFNDGDKNVIRNCVFTKAKLRLMPGFAEKNTVTGNKEQ